MCTATSVTGKQKQQQKHNRASMYLGDTGENEASSGKDAKWQIDRIKKIMEKQLQDNFKHTFEGLEKDDWRFIYSFLFIVLAK